MQGAKLKELGTVAREKLEKFLQRKVSNLSDSTTYLVDSFHKAAV